MIQGKLFTTENTKDTEKISLLTQHIRISVFSATAPALLYLLHHAVVCVLRGYTWIFSYLR
jgi:hypothetical protein